MRLKGLRYLAWGLNFREEFPSKFVESWKECDWGYRFSLHMKDGVVSSVFSQMCNLSLGGNFASRRLDRKGLRTLLIYYKIVPEQTEFGILKIVSMGSFSHFELKPLLPLVNTLSLILVSEHISKCRLNCVLWRPVTKILPIILSFF